MIQHVPEQADVSEVELELLLEGIYKIYGYDFRQYAASSLRRRITHRMLAERLNTISQLQDKVLHDLGAMRRLLQDLSIPVTEMFRDPEFYLAFREKIVPELRTIPRFRIWHAGCSTGEEAYSMAILLREEELEGRATIYATDMNRRSLEQARTGVFPLARMQQYTQNYLRAGGAGPFSDYYSIVDGEVRFDPTLQKQMVFAHHNLATDHSFNEFQVIFCRNVLIYFNQMLQQRVLKLFHGSLVPGGTLALGSRESVIQRDGWEEIDSVNKMYRAI